MVINHCDPSTIGVMKILIVDARGTFKYLGIVISPWTGISQHDVTTLISDTVEKISVAPIKPT